MEISRTGTGPIVTFGLICFGASLAPYGGMKQPSLKRQRTLALQEREQLVRAADSTSNNLVEADDAVSDADFLNKMGIALREAKESRTELMKLRLGRLDNHEKASALDLESEATQLTAIFSTIIRNMRFRLEAEKSKRKGGPEPPYK